MSEQLSQPDASTAGDEPTPSHDATSPWMRRALLAGVFFAGMVVAVALAQVFGDGSGDDRNGQEAVPLATVDAEVRSLATTVAYAGTLEVSEPLSITARTGGTVTSAAAAGGDALQAGDVLWTIDDAPTVLIYGGTPMYRELDSSVDPGPDVHQLEVFLATHGYDNGDPITIDDEFDSSTTNAVREWQEDTGQDVTGDVAAGAMVAVPGPATVLEPPTVGEEVASGAEIATLAAELVAVTMISPTAGEVTGVVPAGSPVEPGAALLSIDGEPVLAPDLGAGAVVIETSVADGDDVEEGRPLVMLVAPAPATVTLQVAPADLGPFTIGASFDVELSDGSIATATVTEVATSATSDGDAGGDEEEGDDAEATVEVRLRVESAEGELLAGPVDVLVPDQARDGVVAVPTRALLALAEGGQGVEIIGNDGTTRLVGVETGLFADGWVEIVSDTGDGVIVAGTSVVVPQ